MKTPTRLCSLFALVVVLTLARTTARGEMGGERRRQTYYAGSFQRGPDSKEKCEFSVEIDDVTFLLSSVQNKYKVVAVKVQNWGATTIPLSGEKDRIDARMPSG